MMKARRIRWAELVARKIVAYKVGVENPEGKKRLLVKSRIRCEIVIRWNIIGCKLGVESSGLGWDQIL
jgi:hypothetical protein